MVQGPAAAALVPLGADQAVVFRFHLRLREHPNTCPRQAVVLVLEGLANTR